MAGESEQARAARAYNKEIGGLETNVRNRFDSYKNPFDYGQMSKNLEDIYGGYEDIINRDTAEMIANQQSGAASSLASRGITGGSILTDTQSGIASNINKTKANAFANLGIGKASQLGDLMRYFNSEEFKKAQAATGVDFGNVGNIFKKLGLKSGAINMLDDTTWLDDLWAGLNAAGEAAKGAGSLIKAVGSDIRLKENLIKVGVKNGINIYEFNYIGNPKRFRGVIAQEVPQASIDVGGGILFVDYSKLGISFEEV